MRIQFTLDFNMWALKLRTLISKFTIFHYLSLYFAVHLLQIAFPSDGSLVFDEAYYTKCSLATLQGIACNGEHPPLPKLIGAVGIWLFGNNWFGWRFPVVLMGIGALFLFYLLAKRFMGDPWALGATILLSLDTLWFIHSGTLLLEMPMFLFVFLALELYFQKHYMLSAVSMGIAFTAREMAIFPFIALGIYHIYANRKMLKPALKIGLKYALVAVLIFGIIMQAYDMGYHAYSAASVANYVNANVVMNNGTALTTIYSTTQSVSKVPMLTPIDNLQFWWAYHGPTGMNFPNETYAPWDYAWNWIMPCDPVNQTCQPLNSPTYYRVDVNVGANGVTNHYTPIWYQAQANLAVWYGFIPALIGLSYALVKRKETENALFMLSGMVLTYAPWLVISLVVKRIGFNYYFLYVLPFVALGMVFTWKQLGKYGKPVLLINILMALWFFLAYFPIHPMP